MENESEDDEMTAPAERMAMIDVKQHSQVLFATPLVRGNENRHMDETHQRNLHTHHKSRMHEHSIIKKSVSEPSTTHRTTHRMRGDHHFLALSLPAYVNFFFEIFEIIKWKTDLNPSIVVLRREK